MRGKMEEREILTVLGVLPRVAAVLMMAFLISLSRERAQILVLRTCREFSGLLREKGRKSSWYARTGKWLTKKGAEFHYGKWINPVSFLAVSIGAALSGFLAGFTFSLWYGILAAVILYLLPAFLLHYLDKKDNERMLPEVKLVYHALAAQIQAGIYVTDALAECYGSVRDKRLRRALLDLAGDIVMKADTFQALEKFQAGFDNRYIDSLCITILQALESGQAVELLNDMGNQIRDMESAVLERRKGNLDRSITFYQLGVLAAVLGVALYACIGYMLREAVRF